MKLSVITTAFPKNQKEQTRQEFEFLPDDGTEHAVVNLYPEVVYQTFLGFGGACTDSAGYVYGQMERDLQEQMLQAYFDEQQMDYSLIRMPLDSCDFSVEHYEAMSNPHDLEMESFSLERAGRYSFPLMEDAQRVRGRSLEVMVSPWSPPAFMKSNQERNHGGVLLEEHKGFWANYICRYIHELRKLGYQVTRMSLQNEPKAVQRWDSCIYSDIDEKVFLRDYMYPALKQHGLADVEIFIWDHNKERVYERACAIIDEETNHMVAGIAFHWYSGDHFEALDLIRQKFPDKILAMSEACIEYSKYAADDYLGNAQTYAHDIIGNLNHGMQVFYDWNLVLDEQGGPNHVGNYCDAPYLYDMQSKRLIERNTQAYIWHFSHFIKKGAKRVGFSRYTSHLEVTAFENPDGTVVVIFMNQDEDEKVVNLRMSGQFTSLTIPGKSISSGIIVR